MILSMRAVEYVLTVLNLSFLASGTRSVKPFSWNGAGQALQAGLRAAQTHTGGNAPKGTLKQKYPWYLTGSEIQSEVKTLAADCGDARLVLSTRSAQGTNGNDVVLDVVYIHQPNLESPDSKKKKAFFVFGEHAREVISPETGLQFMRMICGHSSDTKSKELASRVLAHTDFVIIPNANPKTRAKVEAGEFCRRTNEDGVDLNRNWGEQHSSEQRIEQKGDEMNPGPSEFSEPETQILRDLVIAESPDLFVSVHSGAYLMGTPFGYTDKVAPANEKDMLDLLKPISKEFCNGDCPFGDLASTINYKSTGCDIDFVKENLETPYVYTMEIYAGPRIRGYYAEKAHAQTEGREMSSDAAAFFYKSSLTFLQQNVGRFHQSLRGSHADAQRTMVPESSLNPADCFNQFNPESKAETAQVAENWSKAFLTLCDEVSAHTSKSKVR